MKKKQKNESVYEHEQKNEYNKGHTAKKEP
jgi:hypothetical protein